MTGDLTRDLAVIGVSIGAVRRSENDVVEEIERFGAEFEESRFSQMELAEHGHVHVVVVLGYEWVYLFVAIRIPRWRSEGAGIEPLLDRMCPAVRIANHIHSFLKATAYVLGVAAGGNRVWLP